MANTNPSYSREVHDKALQAVLVTHSKVLGESFAWLLVCGFFTIFCALSQYWIACAMHVAVFAYWYWRRSVSKSLVDAIVAGVYDYPNPIVEEALKPDDSE